MNIFETIILGLTQGLTEFIPISSSGHLIIVQQLFSGGSDHLFVEFINIGTLLSLLVYFRVRIMAILHDVFVRRNYKLASNILITAIPAGLVGYIFASFIEQTPFFGSLTVVIVTLTVVGILMVVIEKLPKASLVTDGQSLSKKRALLIGLAQMFALIPGVSRSGTTIIAGRLSGLSSAAAAEYSFLASLPIMFGVTLKLFTKASDRAYFMEHFPMLLLSNTVAFIAGIIAVGFLMRYLAHHSLAIFGWYRIGLAALLTIYLLVQ